MCQEHSAIKVQQWKNVYNAIQYTEIRMNGHTWSFCRQPAKHLFNLALDYSLHQLMREIQMDADACS